MLDLSFYSQNVSIFDAIVTQKALVGKGMSYPEISIHIFGA